MHHVPGNHRGRVADKLAYSYYHGRGNHGDSVHIGATMREFSQPQREMTTNDQNVLSILVDRVERDPDGELIDYKNGDGIWESFTAREFLDTVESLAKGLIAKGVRPGDSVSILSRTRWEWTALDMAILAIGGVTVPVYETNSPAQITAIFRDSNVVMAFAEDAEQSGKISRVRGEVPALTQVFTIDSGDLPHQGIREHCLR